MAPRTLQSQFHTRPSVTSVLLISLLSDAKTNIRDYHGKTAAHYWSGGTDIFDKPDALSGEEETFVLKSDVCF